MSDLLPCPFCGATPEATTWEVGNFGDQEAGVLCRSCGATHAMAIDRHETAEEVASVIERQIAAWNRRSPIH